jgi:transcriptional regulator with XRE-family HTH domain
MKPKPEEIQRILSGNVKTLRNKLKLTQERLADAAGLSAQTINDIEGCRKWISAKTITRLSAALDVECFQLLIPGYFSQNRKDTTPAQNLMKLKEKMLTDVDSLIDSQITEFIKTGLVK